MVNKKVLSSVLVLIVLTSSFYLIFDNDVKIDIEKTKTEYSINQSGDWLLTATEYVNLYDGTTKMRAKSRELITNENNDTYNITRKSIWKDNITTIQTYVFEKENRKVERTPLLNIFECFNCEGKIVHYEIRDIQYVGETKKLVNSPFYFGNKMFIEWLEEPYYAKIFQQKSVDKIILKYRPNSSHAIYNVRIYDPIINTFNNSLSVENITFSGDENITRYLRLPLTANVTNATMFIKGYANTSFTTKPYIEINNTKIFDLPLNCYQESTSVPDQDGTDGSKFCGLNYSGSSFWTGNVFVLNQWQFYSNAFDGDYSTFAQWFNRTRYDLGELTLVSFKYIKPSHEEYRNNFLWQYSLSNGGSIFTNQSQFTEDCIFNVDYIFLYFTQNTIFYPGNPSALSLFCDISPSTARLLKSQSPPVNIWEEGVWWVSNGSFFSNRSLEFTDELNIAFNNGNCDCSGCVIDSSRCLIPFIFHSDSEGIIEYSELSVNYTFEEIDFNATLSPDTELKFIPDNATQQGLNAIGQNSSVGVFTINNNLTSDIDIYAKLNETHPNITMKIGADNNYSNSVSITTDYYLIYENLSINDTQYLWAWADYDNSQTTYFPDLSMFGGEL